MNWRLLWIVPLMVLAGVVAVPVLMLEASIVGVKEAQQNALRGKRGR